MKKTQRITICDLPYRVYGYAGRVRVLIPAGEYLATMTEFERPDSGHRVRSLFLVAAQGAPNTYVVFADELRDLDEWPQLPETGSPFRPSQ